jgi:hypothetical protein
MDDDQPMDSDHDAIGEDYLSLLRNNTDDEILLNDPDINSKLMKITADINQVQARIGTKSKGRYSSSSDSDSDSSSSSSDSSDDSHSNELNSTNPTKSNQMNSSHPVTRNVPIVDSSTSSSSDDSDSDDSSDSSEESIEFLKKPSMITTPYHKSSKTKGNVINTSSNSALKVILCYIVVFIYSI